MCSQALLLQFLHLTFGRSLRLHAFGKAGHVGAHLLQYVSGHPSVKADDDSGERVGQHIHQVRQPPAALPTKPQCGVGKGQ